MPNKLRFWGCMLLIAAIFMIDGQYFSEGYKVNFMSPVVRQLAHLALLALTAAVGYWGWASQPEQWVKRFWLVAYALVAGLLVLTGAIQHLLQPFGPAFLDTVGLIRLFFTSPMPYFILFLLTRMAGRMDAGANG